ncbi:EAL domain-containing protein [Dactylosporangium roseum]|uniref:EAL domain-containing protein n=1 Tax=Dactylosporangium roseum TaxID=47989 RepID=A0ABY5ZD18_9ACTN|nr:EAL domain-containing protein [Dactylosporangium roseum]UWZ38583.1 EAL domain-containing protein [Dactylosporangium roseum]
MTAWRWYATLGLGVVAIGGFLPVVPRQGLYTLVGVSAAVVLGAGIRRYRPADRRSWLLFTAAIWCSVAAAAGYAAEYLVTGRVGVPAWKDLPFLGGYLCMALGTLAWVRPDPARPRAERFIDSGIVASGVAALAWTFIVHPLLFARPVDMGHAASHVTYISTDLVLVVLTTRMIFTSSVRSPAHTLVACALGVVITGDVVYYAALAWTGETYGDGMSTALYLCAYALIGTAALHPSMAGAAGRPERHEQVIPRHRVYLYSILALVGPVVAITTLLVWSPLPSRWWVLVPLATSVVTSVLLIARLSQLVQFANRRAADLDAQAVTLGGALREQETLRQQLTHRALHDALTGLGNRALLQERLEHALARTTSSHGLLLLDLDGFKDVNDSFGHPVGDALLIEVAARLLGEVSTSDTLVRLGGDEFAILLEDVSPPRLSTIGASVVAALGQPYTVGERELNVTTSIGSLHFSAPSTPAEALRNADLALYAAKAAGKNRLAAYEPRLAVERHEHMRLAADLRRAVAEDEFVVNYQPVVDLSTGRVTAVEALLRWSPGGRPVPPLEFIPIAEQYGLIVPIGAWVLRQACEDARPWYERFGISVTVNVSGRQLREPDFASVVLGALREAGLPGEALILEITETVLVSSTADADDVAALLSTVRAEGVRIAVDDFGTGYSSLAYLRHLPVDILKIDRAFTPEGGMAEEMAFTRAIVELGNSLRLSSIAEAVETPEQAERLRELDCHLAQGYHFSRPLPASDLDAMLTSTNGVLDGASLRS